MKAARKKYASQKQMSLLPNKKKATLRNLTKEFLQDRDISKSDLVYRNFPEDKEYKYIHKGFISLSLFVQILLKLIAQPLKKFGRAYERFLNRDLIRKNTDAGKEARLIDEESDGFISYLGNLDRRIELHKDIKRGDGRYYPVLSMMAAKLAYENKSIIKRVVSHHWKMEFVDFYDCQNEFLKERTTQAFIMRDQNEGSDMFIVAFRGTSPFDAYDWSTDFDLSWLKIDGMGKLHKGFMMALGLKKCFPEGEDGDYYGDWPKEIQQEQDYQLAYYTIREKLRTIVANNKRAKFIVTGHSLGGALAVLFPAILALHGEEEILDRLEAIYTFGQPRVGNTKFGQFMKMQLKKHNIKYYRIVYGYDSVPTVPFDNTLMTFKHFGTCIHFNSLYQGKIVKEEQQKKVNRVTYLRLVKLFVFILIEWILARIIAVWQLIRGFIIGFTAGPDFREGWLLLSARIFGILFPGFVDHNPHDYVNATLLASEDLFRDSSTLQW